MKKKIISLVIVLACLYTCSFAQTLTLKNTTSCSPVIFVVYAHDCSACVNSASCALVSNPVAVPIGGSITYSDVTALNSSPGWTGGVTASGGAGSGWDGITYIAPPVRSGCSSSLGQDMCISTNTSTIVTCSCVQWHGVWQVDAFGNITVNVTDWN